MANKTSPNTTLLCLYTTPSEANENIEYSERMSEVIPVNYMIWKLGFMLLFLAITVYTCIEIYKRAQVERKSSIQNFDLKEFLYKPKNTTLSLILIASFLRILWLIDPHERSEAFWGHIYGTGRKGRAAVEILLKVPRFAYRKGYFIDALYGVVVVKPNNRRPLVLHLKQRRRLPGKHR